MTEIAASGLVYGLAALTSTGLAIHQGEQQKRAGKQGLNRQLRAQEEAKNAALSQRRAAEMAQAEANQRAPDISSLLAFEQQGADPSMAFGGSRPKPRLDRPTLLGDL